MHSDEGHTPRWSPDGEVLAYFTDSGSIRAYTAGTGAVRTIADNPGLDARMIVWTGDGKRVLTFRTHRSRYDDTSVRIELIEVDAGSGAQRPLLDVPDYTEPLCSPDGRHFALDMNGSILVHDENGVLVERLSDSRIAATGNDERLSIGPWTWTPDGSRLVFCSTVLALNTKTSADIRSALHVWDLRSDHVRTLADDCDFDHIEVRSTAR